MPLLTIGEPQLWRCRTRMPLKTHPIIEKELRTPRCAQRGVILGGNIARLAGRRRGLNVPAWVQEVWELEMRRIRVNQKQCRRYGHSKTNLDGCNLCRRCGTGLSALTGKTTDRLATVIVMRYGKTWMRELQHLERERRRVIPTLT